MSKRILRLNQLIMAELGRLILKEMEFPKDTLATLTRVQTSSDLRECGVWVSALPENKRSEVVGLLNRRVYFLQQKLNERLRMRPVPKIRFLEETMTEEAGKIEGILEQLKKRER